MMSTVGGTDRDDPTGKAKKAERKRKGIKLTDLLAAVTDETREKSSTTYLQEIGETRKGKRGYIRLKDRALIMEKVG